MGADNAVSLCDVGILVDQAALVPDGPPGPHRCQRMDHPMQARRYRVSRIFQDRETDRFLREIAAGRGRARYREPSAAERGRQGVQPLPGNGGRRAVASLRPRAGRASHPGPVTFQRRRLLAAAAALLVITTSSAGLARLSWLVTHASPPARTGTCGVRARPAAGPATQRGPSVTCRHADPLTPPRDFARLGAAVAAWLLRPPPAPLVPQGPDCASLPATTRPASRRPAVHRGRHRIRLVALEQRPDRYQRRDLRRPPGVSASSQATPLIGPADARRPLVRAPDQPAAVAAAPAGRRERQMQTDWAPDSGMPEAILPSMPACARVAGTPSHQPSHVLSEGPHLTPAGITVTRR